MNWSELDWYKLIGPCVQFLGMIVAAPTVVWQLGKQRKNSSALQRENAREALRLRIYELLVQRIRVLSDACSDAKMYAFGIPSSIVLFKQQQSEGYKPSQMRQRVPEFSDLHFKAQRQLADLIVDLECWSIALPGVIVFKVVFSAAAYDVQQAFSPLFSSLLNILPMDPPFGATGPMIEYPPPSAETLAHITSLIEKYTEAMDDLQSYIYDLTVEAQNDLLYGLFESKVPPRQPLDPRFKVISTDPKQSSALIRYFENETPWGKNQAAIRAELRPQSSHS